MSTTKAFSAPGKAFIAGGYLVLEPIYDAYVVALSARMHAVVKSGPNTSSIPTITVKSPQFQEAVWQYEVGELVKEVNGNKNPFLQATVQVVSQYLGELKQSIEITIYSDPGFHTQANTTTKNSTNGQRRFLYHQSAINDVAKTGLGSSASLVAVVTTAIMSQTKEVSKDVLHNLAQIAHCKAQKKIGSGFDVATAVYGSIRYRRFQPQVIDKYLQSSTPQTFDLKGLVETPWDFSHLPCALPPHIKLLMGDIKGGSETPKLVSIVLDWKKRHPEQALELYTQLNQANLSLMDALTQLHQFYESEKSQYLKAIQVLKNTAGSDIESTSPDIKPFFAVVEAIKNIRTYLKQLTQESTADIEPDSQTKLLNDCSTLKGCLGGVVPGAGGYDAISLLVIDESIDSIIDHTKSDDNFSQVTWLSLTQQAEGVVSEVVNDYEGI